MDNVWDDYLDQNSMFFIRGKEGVEHFKKLIHDLDPKYTSVDKFLIDNREAIDCLMEYIQDKVEWKASWENNLEKTLTKD